jgi:hypothetical protein
MKHKYVSLNESVSNYKEQSPSKANSSSATQEIPHILWNLKIQYHVHSSLALVHIQTKQPFLFFMVHLNINSLYAYLFPVVCGFFPPCFSFKFCMNLISFPLMPHAPLIASSLI